MHTLLKNKYLFIFLVLMLGCTNHQKNETSGKRDQSQFDGPLKIIESHFDSLTTVYQKAIDYLENHPDDSLFVKNQYQIEAAHHFNLIVETMENVNKQYQDKELSMDVYNDYVSNLKKMSEGFREKKMNLLNMVLRLSCITHT